MLIYWLRTIIYILYIYIIWTHKGRRGRDHMVVGFTTTYANSVYHHWCCEFESHSGDTTLCDKVCQWLATGQWFSSGTPVSSTNKTDRHDITGILLKVELNTIKPNQTNTKGYVVVNRRNVYTIIHVQWDNDCWVLQGRIQDFKLGGALKKNAPSRGRCENLCGISCEKSRFYVKKSYFFQL